MHRLDGDHPLRDHLVEQNALMALDIAQRGYVLETGRVALADNAKSLRENEQVRKTYLGED